MASISCKSLETLGPLVLRSRSNCGESLVQGKQRCTILVKCVAKLCIRLGTATGSKSRSSMKDTCTLVAASWKPFTEATAGGLESSSTYIGSSCSTLIRHLLHHRGRYTMARCFSSRASAAQDVIDATRAKRMGTCRKSNAFLASTLKTDWTFEKAVAAWNLLITSRSLGFKSSELFQGHVRGFLPSSDVLHQSWSRRSPLKTG